MISYQEALEIILKHRFEARQEVKELNQCLGRILDEDLVADRDFPPFDRVTMDGIAINFESFQNGRRDFKVEGVVAAGHPQKTLGNPENCLEVMTGAVLPQKTDTVIRYEDIAIESGTARVSIDEIKLRQNIHFRGLDRKSGEKVVSRGSRISPAEISVAAAIGKSQLKLAKMPATLIVSTGDELVEVSQSPAPHQIRNSNSPGLDSVFSSWGIIPDHMHLPDDKEKMVGLLGKAMVDYDALVLIGSVSKGKFDYLPQVLEDLNVQKLFHRVSQRPGKPFWFGKANSGTTVFALPGNPVSTLVCACAYIKGWIEASLNVQDNQAFAILGEDLKFERDLTFFPVVRSKYTDMGEIIATPVPGHGSGDFISLTEGDGFLILPPEKNLFRKGEAYPYLAYR